MALKEIDLIYRTMFAELDQRTLDGSFETDFSLAGSFVGGIVLGIVQVLAGTWFGPAAQLVGGYLLILFVLAVRPQGLFAR